MTSHERTDDLIRDELSFEEFLAVDELEDDLGLEPEDADAPSAEEERHPVTPAGALDPALADSVDVGGIEAALASQRVAEPPARTETSEGLDESSGAEPHELGVDEMLDATTRRNDPARVHDWVGDDESRRHGHPAGDVALRERERGDFVCSACFLVRPASQRSGDGDDVCVDCAGD